MPKMTLKKPIRKKMILSKPPAKKLRVKPRPYAPNPRRTA